MKINPKETIAGFPLLKIRDLLKAEMAHSVRGIAYFLKIDKGQAEQVLQTLLELEYIEEETDAGETIYVNTIKGNALGLAKAIPSISRAKAEELFSGFMQRVNEVNSNDYYLYKVTKVILFGSYLTDSPTVNDIDIVIETQQKETDPKLGREKKAARSKEAAAKGVTFRNIIDYHFYPDHEVKQFLKSKSRYLSLHSSSDEVLEEAVSSQVYPSKV